jgi:hypothetical protein
MYQLPLDHLALRPDHYGHRETYRTCDHSLQAAVRHASRAQRRRRRGFSILQPRSARVPRNGGSHV